MKYVLVFLFLRNPFSLFNNNNNTSEDGKHKITMKMLYFRVPETKCIYKIYKLFFK